MSAAAARAKLPGRRGRYWLALTTGVCWALLSASGAAAESTVGQTFALMGSTCGSNTFLQTGVASGNSYTVPVSGVIFRWSFQDGGTQAGGLKLKVGRSAGGNNYLIVGEASAGAQAPNSVNSYSTNIPVQAGDLIGISTTGGPCGALTGNPSDTFVEAAGDQAAGTTATFTPVSGSRFPVQALVAQTPGLSSLSPASGSVSGGTSVLINGHDLTSASAVNFGGIAASGFSVNSDDQITALSPPASAPGPIDVRVTTAAGTTPVVGTDRFTYNACVVPRLKGKRLKRARKTLRNRACGLGKVKGPRSGKIKRQSPRAGTVLPPGSKVRVKLG